MPKKALVILFALAVIAVGGWWFFGRSPDPDGTQSDNGTRQQDNLSGFEKNKYSIDEPGSIWWIMNKNRPLPDGYKPSDLTVPDVRLRLGRNAEQMSISGAIANEVEALFDAAAQDGVTLVFGSGFRSYDLQKQFYDSYVAQDGQEAADRYSARPGTSEHQSGLVFDATNLSETCHLEICFVDTPEGAWLAEHAHEHGFIIRYPNGKESITAYQYEPWHLRYVGKELAAELHRTGQTMEEFFGLVQ